LFFIGAKTKVSSAERWKRKKAGIVDTSAESVTKLTSVANEILTKTGNMDIYQETYENLKTILNRADKKSAGNTSSKNDGELDMYADDFDSKEKEKITEIDKEESMEEELDNKEEEVDKKGTQLAWEFKWSQGDDVEVHGPHNTDQMQQWVKEGYFKTGVWVRKCGIEGPFYTSNRIDCELYV
jgi:CD2 antigen cytoplasmic tail-binding protein 2